MMLIIFSNKEVNVESLIDYIKLSFWRWFLNKFSVFVYFLRVGKELSLCVWDTIWKSIKLLTCIC